MGTNKDFREAVEKELSYDPHAAPPWTASQEAIIRRYPAAATGTSRHRPPFRLRLLPLSWPGALSPM